MERTSQTWGESDLRKSQSNMEQQYEISNRTGPGAAENKVQKHRELMKGTGKNPARRGDDLR